jgi:hypothetical protein
MTYKKLNSNSREERLAAIRQLGERIKDGIDVTSEVNNHVHSIYSFSPYSPTMAAVKAAEAGLQAVGIMDHDSVSGCEEMLEACKAINIGSTAGFEMRVDMKGTICEGRKVNNPDTLGNAYIAIHGIPSGCFAKIAEFLKPINKARYERGREEVKLLNKILISLSAPELDFEKDVWGISQAEFGGSITERHILYALAKKLTAKYGKGKDLVDFVKNQMKIDLNGNLETLLLDESNPHYEYDLLGCFKSTLIEQIFIQPSEVECISVFDAVKFANDLNAIPSYAYLGDIDESPTGDKKAEKFEDAYLDELIPELKRIGFKAVTYMPPRNTLKQLLRIQQLCAENELMEISGVDINSSRQTFSCPIILTPEFSHLTESTWALIAHEKLATNNAKYALFNSENPMASFPLKERVAKYAEIGRKIDNREPERAIELV